jgi:hypothetical protein
MLTHQVTLDEPEIKLAIKQYLIRKNLKCDIKDIDFSLPEVEHGGIVFVRAMATVEQCSYEPNNTWGSGRD